jgi:hypothetical protein
MSHARWPFGEPVAQEVVGHGLFYGSKVLAPNAFLRPCQPLAIATLRDTPATGSPAQVLQRPRDQLTHRPSRHRRRRGHIDLLVDLGFVDEVGVVGAMDLDELETQARRILAVGTQAIGQRVDAPALSDGPTSGGERAWALSQLVADHARYDPDVVVFRRKYLGDMLVEWADLDTWIMARAKLDGERTTDITVVVPAGSATSIGEADELSISPPLGVPA